MAMVLRIRRLTKVVYRVIRERRDVCGVDEYYDEVVGHCSLCSEICLPQRGTMNICASSCPSYYRRMAGQQLQQQDQQVSEAVGQASTVPDLKIVIPLIVTFGVLFLVGVILSVMLYRRHRRSFCTKSPKDECPETDLKRSGLDSGGNAAERERLNADLERGGLPSCSAGDRLSSSPPEAEEAPSSLCSIEIIPNQAHNHQHDLHQKQLHHHSHQTSIMNVI